MTFSQIAKKMMKKIIIQKPLKNDQLTTELFTEIRTTKSDLNKTNTKTKKKRLKKDLWIAL